MTCMLQDFLLFFWDRRLKPISKLAERLKSREHMFENLRIEVDRSVSGKTGSQYTGEEFRLETWQRSEWEQVERILLRG